jgi:hypothetical protein
MHGGTSERQRQEMRECEIKSRLFGNIKYPTGQIPTSIPLFPIVTHNVIPYLSITDHFMKSTVMPFVFVGLNEFVYSFYE